MSSKLFEPMGWVADNMIRVKCVGYSVGDQQRVKFEGNEYIVVVVNKEDDIAIAEVLNKIQDDTSILDSFCKLFKKYK